MQLQNRSFQVVDWKKKTTAKYSLLNRVKLLVFIVKYAIFSRSRLSRRHGYLSSSKSVPHGPPCRYKSSLLVIKKKKKNSLR